MGLYHHVLMVVGDAMVEERKAAIRAKSIAGLSGAHLSLVSPLQPFVRNISAYMLPSLENVQASYRRAARGRVRAIAQLCDVSERDQALREGTPEQVIIQEAQRQHADLIVIDAVQNKSTAKALLHHARCDILVVRS